jgi:hypothetical protein
VRIEDSGVRYINSLKGREEMKGNSLASDIRIETKGEDINI